MSVPFELMRNVLEEVIPFHKYLGVKLLEVKPGFAKLSLRYAPEFVGDPRKSRWHGGVIATLLDAVGGAAGITTLTSQEDKISTIDMRVDYLVSSEPKDIYVEGEIIRSGNRIVVTKMSAYHEKDKLIAEGRGAYNVWRREA